MTAVLPKLRRIDAAASARVPRYVAKRLLGRNGVLFFFAKLPRSPFFPSSGLCPRIEGSRAALMLAACLLLSAQIPIVHAHEGHEENTPVAIAPQTPRLSYQSTRIESVALIDAQGLTIWVDDFASNRPLSNIAVDARVGSGAVQAQEIEPGTYRVPLDLLGDSGATDIALSLSLRGKDWQEHYEGHLPRPSADKANAADEASDHLRIAEIAAAIVIVIVALIVWRRRRRA
jgi:hypothetical protein